MVRPSDNIGSFTPAASAAAWRSVRSWSGWHGRGSGRSARAPRASDPWRKQRLRPSPVSMLAEFHCVATGSFDAGVGQEAYYDHPVIRAALAGRQDRCWQNQSGPSVPGVVRLRHEIGMPFTAPGPFGKNLPFTRSNLIGALMLPFFIVSRLPAMMCHDENPHARPGLAKQLSENVIRPFAPR